MIITIVDLNPLSKNRRYFVKKAEKKKRKIPINIDYQTEYQGKPCTIKFRILALPDDLLVLAHLNHDEQSQIFEEFISKAWAHATNKLFRKPRGKYIGCLAFASRMRYLARKTYILVEGLLKNHSDTKFVKKLNAVFEEKNKGRLRDERGRVRKGKPYEITHFIMERIFGEEKNKYPVLKEWDDRESFRRTYISNVRRYRLRRYFGRVTPFGFLFKGFKPKMKRRGVDKDPLMAFRLFYIDLIDDPRFEETVNPHK
jgi:hypothetical protein